MYVEISNLCPLNFVDKARVLGPNYNFKHMDAWLTDERRLPFMYAPKTHHKWENGDIIFLQIKCDFDPALFRLVDENGFQIIDINMTIIKQVGADFYMFGAMSLTDVAKGCYRAELHMGNYDDPDHLVLESEELLIAPKWPGTLLIKYSHHLNTNDSIFENNLYYLLRVEGYLYELDFIGNRVVYIDNPFNAKTVKGRSARLWKLFLGNGAGVPDCIPDKIQDIMDLSSVDYDGLGLSAADSGQKLEAIREDNVSNAAWTIVLRETTNRRAKRFDGTGIVLRRVVIDYIVEGKLFGPTRGSANDNTYTINEIE